MEKNSNVQRETERKLSWTELSEEEILKITDVSVCMYGKQDNSQEGN